MNVVVGGKPGVSSDTVRAGRYKGSFSGYSKRESVHTITVGADWYIAVWKINLETHEGRLVLATNYEGVTEDGRTMFQILTVRQGTGTALVTEWLAVIGSSSTEWLTAPKTLPVIHAMPPEIAADYIQDRGDEPTAVALRTRAGY